MKSFLREKAQRDSLHFLPSFVLGVIVRFSLQLKSNNLFVNMTTKLFLVALALMSILATTSGMYFILSFMFSFCNYMFDCFFSFTFCLLFLKGLKCYKCVSSSKSSSFSVNFDSCQQGIGLFMEQEECSFPFTYCAVIRTNDQFSGVPSVSRTCSIYVPPIAGFTSVCSSDLCNNSKLARVQHFYIN